MKRVKLKRRGGRRGRDEGRKSRKGRKGIRGGMILEKGKVERSEGGSEEFDILGYVIKYVTYILEIQPFSDI